jgi:omega-6 fatty acid desaturase (delta-12 desaturase)
MALIIFQHHTHPEVPWFAGVNEWTFFQGQVESVVHVELPRPIELFLNNILDHTAHHVDPKIPLYNLPSAQRNLETAYPANIKVVPWTLQGFRTTFAVCRLYDYENHRWLNFDGTPTSERHKLGPPNIPAA